MLLAGLDKVLDSWELHSHGDRPARIVYRLRPSSRQKGYVEVHDSVAAAKECYNLAPEGQTSLLLLEPNHLLV